MANTTDLVLYQASSSNISNTTSGHVAKLYTTQEAVQKEIDGPASKRYFICQLLDTGESSQKSILQKHDQSFNKTPEATGFGTLITLPFEVRQRIWHEVLKVEIYDDSCLGGEPIRYMGGRNWYTIFQYPYLDPGSRFKTFDINLFRGNSYSVCKCPLQTLYRKRRSPGFQEHLSRLISHAVKGELEDLFLRNHTFEFECPEFLDRFLGQLSRRKAIQLRQISFVVFACNDCYVEPCWGRVIERLPKTINVVLIELDAMHAYEHSLPDREYRNLSRKLIKKVLGAADVLRNQILRQLPHARIFLVGSLFPRLRASDRAALESLSGDKTWSNLDRKILM